MNIRTNFEDYARSLDIDPVEAALMDVARAIQITLTMHREAESHYRGLANHVDRPGSPFEDLVDEIYASGSFAIHAPTRSRLKRDQHDVDAVIELSVLPGSDPEWVLSTLYKAIKGDPDSKYHDYLIEKNSRCVTVTYPDGVTVDLMPVVRLAGTPERVANLFHHKPETGTQYHKEVNPKGFADHFNRQIETSQTFQDRFDARRFLVDGETYKTMAKRMASDGSTIKADTQPMPVHVPLDQKSPRVVALQLIKRFRDKQFRKHDDHRGKRKPPSIIMAAIALEAGPVQDNLVGEVISLATRMRRRIQDAESYLRLLEVRNPAHTPDVFTDRWPEQRSDQQLWARDLQTLIDRLKTLQRVGFDPAAIQSTFDDLFGEKAGEAALRAYHQARVAQLEHGALGMKPGGEFKPAAPALGAGVSAASGLITPARANTNMGGVVPDDNCW